MLNASELPSMFGKHGEWIGLPPDALQKLKSDSLMFDLYKLIVESAEELECLEISVRDVEQQLKDKVQALRQTQARIARLPRLTQQDLLRQVQRSNRS